jgi:hypothetical protein
VALDLGGIASNDNGLQRAAEMALHVDDGAPEAIGVGERHGEAMPRPPVGQKALK